MVMRTKPKDSSALAMSLAGRYSYRVMWSWRRLGYTVTCEEVWLWDEPCISNVEELLEATRNAVARAVDGLMADGIAVPHPVRPDGRAFTERSLHEALRRSLDEIPFDGVLSGSCR